MLTEGIDCCLSLLEDALITIYELFFLICTAFPSSESNSLTLRKSVQPSVKACHCFPIEADIFIGQMWRGVIKQSSLSL